MKEELEDLGVDGKIILLWIIRMYDGNARTGLFWLIIETRGIFYGSRL